MSHRLGGYFGPGIEGGAAGRQGGRTAVVEHLVQDLVDGDKVVADGGLVDGAAEVVEEHLDDALQELEHHHGRRLRRQRRQEEQPVAEDMHQVHIPRRDDRAGVLGARRELDVVDEGLGHGARVGGAVVLLDQHLAPLVHHEQRLDHRVVLGREEEGEKGEKRPR